MNIGNVSQNTHLNKNTNKSSEKATGEKFSDIIKQYQEEKKLTSKQLKEETDWRDMSDEEWDKLIDDYDKYIEEFRENLEELKEKQDEAAQKAALLVDPQMRTIAASEAALAVASGFDGGVTTTSEDESLVEDEEVRLSEGDHEKNWTKKLDTDDQIILRTAKAAQEMEKMAVKKMNAIANGEEVYIDKRNEDKDGFK